MLPILKKFCWIVVQHILEMSNIESNNRGVTCAVSVHLTHFLELFWSTIWLQVLQVGHMTVGALELHDAGILVGTVLFNACSSSNIEDFASSLDGLLGLGEVFCGLCTAKRGFEILAIKNGCKTSLTWIP